MTDPILRETILALLEGDLDLMQRLREAGLLPSDDDALQPEHARTARVAGTLAHELEVNWPGVEVILRMRSELVATRRQVHELLAFLREHGRDDG